MTSIDKRRVAMVIQYLGTDYHGWQRQLNRNTIQEEIEKALTEVVKQPVTIHGAGRTDAGVHAAAQVAHFDYVGNIPTHKWSKILNARLPKDILIRASTQVPLTWHAQFSAIWRRYRYTIYTDKRPNVFLQNFTWHYYHYPLEESLIASALKPLVGKHQLTAFRRAGSLRKHSWVEIQEATCLRQGPLLHLEIQADGFLYGMVRLLVGMLVEVGSGKRTLDNFMDIWVKEKRDQVKYAAPAKGLCLLRVGYREFPFAEKIWFDSQPTFVFNR